MQDFRTFALRYITVDSWHKNTHYTSTTFAGAVLYQLPSLHVEQTVQDQGNEEESVHQQQP
jgi:hypothetical protein